MAVDCLVINLTRFGDLVQSQPLLHDIHACGLRVGLICLENFAQALPLLKHIEEVWTLKGAKLLGNLDKDWKIACKDLLKFVTAIRSTATPKYVINLTSTIYARLLAKLLAKDSAQILGFGLDSDGFGVNCGAWSTFLSSTSACRQNSVFNIADMFRFIGRPLLKNQPYVERRGLNQLNAKTFAELEALLQIEPKLKGSMQGLVALQLGASEKRRMWPCAYFAKLGDYLWQKHRLLPVLTGTNNEKELAKLYLANAQEPCLDLVGATHLDVLAALLKSVKLLISNDTGTIHLAAALDTPSVGFFLSTAQPWDTAPYLQNCLCLEPDLECHPCQFSKPCQHNYRCLQTILPENVALLIDHYLTTNEWLKPNRSLQMRIWQTTLDGHNLASLKCLSEHKEEDRSLFIEHQRNFWCQFLEELENGEPNNAPTTLQQLSAPFLASFIPILKQVLNLLLLLQEQGKIIQINAAIGKLFLRNCNRIQTLLTTNQQLVSFGYFWRELRTDKGQNIEELLAAIKLFAKHLSLFCHNLEYGTNCA